MADLYSQVVRGDGVGSYTVGANARKTTHDTFNYGTPAIYPLVVERTGGGDWTGYADAGSDFHKVVAAIQTRVEIYGIGEVSGNYFTLLVNFNTLAQDDGDEQEPNIVDDLDYLNAEVSAATGITVNIENGKIVSDDINYDC